MMSSILITPLTLPVFLLCIVTAAALGLLLALAFRVKSSMSQGYAMAMTVLPAAVAVVIMLVNGNIGTGLVTAGVFAMVRFRSMPGTAREIAALFLCVPIGLACGMGYIGIAAILTVLEILIVLAMTLTGFCSRPAGKRTMKVTLPEHLDYNTALNEVFEQFRVQAKLMSVRTNNMGTLFEVTYELDFPDGTVPKAFVDEIRVRNSNLAVIINAPGDRDTL